MASLSKVESSDFLWSSRSGPHHVDDDSLSLFPSRSARPSLEAGHLQLIPCPFCGKGQTFPWGSLALPNLSPKKVTGSKAADGNRSLCHLTSGFKVS